jgi:hypothetical protein
MMIHTGSRDGHGPSRRSSNGALVKADPLSWQGGACRQPATARDQRPQRGDDRDERHRGTARNLLGEDTIIHPSSRRNAVSDAGRSGEAKPSYMAAKSSVLDANRRSLRAGAMAMGAGSDPHDPRLSAAAQRPAYGEIFGGNIRRCSDRVSFRSAGIAPVDIWATSRI